MPKKVKSTLILAACLMAAGLAIGMAGLGMAGFDFKELSTSQMETNTYVVEENFSNINLGSDTAKVTFLPATDGKVTVVCYEKTKVKHTVQVEGDTLSINNKDNRKWYDHIGIHFETPKVTVYLPAGEYGDLQIRNSTGDVTVPEQFSFQNAKVALSTGKTLWRAHVVRELDIRCSTGNVTVEDVRCGALNVKVSTGDITLRRTAALGTLKLKATTGDVKLEQVDGGQIDIETTTGDVTGTLCTDKVFNTKTATGKITTPDGKEIVPGQKPSNQCTVSTTTGDIPLEIAN